MTEFHPASHIDAIATRGDRAAFAALFDHFAPRVKTLLMRRGIPAAAAEDLAQETLLTVWRKASQFDPAKAGAATWIFTIARNLSIDAVRRERRAQTVTDEDVMPVAEPGRPDDHLLGAEREDKVRTALDTLSEDQRRVVTLSFFEGRPHGDIAEALGIPLGTVKSRLRLAFQRLRDHLGDLT